VDINRLNRELSPKNDKIEDTSSSLLKQSSFVDSASKSRLISESFQKQSDELMLSKTEQISNIEENEFVCGGGVSDY
jgi:tRNA A37 threonylcarbamoyltransferase TsaD